MAKSFNYFNLAKFSDYDIIKKKTCMTVLPKNKRQ